MTKDKNDNNSITHSINQIVQYDTRLIPVYDIKKPLHTHTYVYTYMNRWCLILSPESAKGMALYALEAKKNETMP